MIARSNGKGTREYSNRHAEEKERNVLNRDAYVELEETLEDSYA